MRILLMTGARPNFVKVAPLIYAIEAAKAAGRDIDYLLVYAGRADDKTLEGTLFEDLGIAPPKEFLGVDSEETIEITVRVMERMEALLEKEWVDVVIVVDDLASTMATAIVAKKRGKKLAHLVAGTRSFDIMMPKEINRLVIDGLSDYLFTAGKGGSGRVEAERVYEVGNILLDTLRRKSAGFARPRCLDALGAEDGEYIVVTINRRKLLAEREVLRGLLEATVEAAEGRLVVAPLRKAARRVVEEMGIEGITIVEPLPYPEFGYLTQRAKAIVTDSGNVAEEASFNGVACITMNDYTEHGETVSQGTNVLVNEDADLLRAALRRALRGERRLGAVPAHWDGHTAERILQTLLEDEREGR